MRKASKILFLCAFLTSLAAFVINRITGQWLNLMDVLYGLSAGMLIAGFAADWKLYREFLSMRTTKHGMNMGMVILLTLTALVCLNYLANKHNKTWDLTAEKLNSLSEQSTKLLDSADGDIEVKVLYKGQDAKEDKQRIKQYLEAFESYSSKVKTRFYNVYIQQDVAIQYLTDASDRDTAPAYVFVEHKGKRVRAEAPFDEAALTSAMIKATRKGESKIYFIKGHGERDIDSQEDQGLMDFAKALGDGSYKVEPLVLIDKKEVPSDAALVAIVGPQVPYLEEEIQWLRDYVKKGGRLFVALDPGQRHNLANLTKTLGVQFENNFVMTMAPIVGGGPATILGRNFDAGSDITKSFPTGASFAVFPLASEVKAASDKVETTEVKELVKSDNFSFTMTDISKPIRERPVTKPVTIGVSVKGKVEAAEAKAKESVDSEKDEVAEKSFAAVVFGDSDFITNRGLNLGVNRDLALNAIADLANQKDLLSIRPKIPKGTIVTLTTASSWATIIGCLSLPVILLVLSGVMWFRRRGA